MPAAALIARTLAASLFLAANAAPDAKTEAKPDAKPDAKPEGAAVNLADPLPEIDVWRAVKWISDMKRDWRGPYEGIAWYCNDGTVQPARARACSKRGGGLQYGVLGPRARALGEQGLYVGTVLAALTSEQLLANDRYRARALVVERYLERVLRGWALERGKTYRGFRQTEDEEAAAARLLGELARDPESYGPHRALTLRLVRALPYGQSAGLADEIRSLAGQLGDADPSFEFIRFKIHAMPEPTDVRLVEHYARGKRRDLARAAAALAQKLDALYGPETRRARLELALRGVAVPNVRVALEGFIAADGQDAEAWIEKGLLVMRAANDALAKATDLAGGARNLAMLHVISLVEETWIGAAAYADTLQVSRRQALRVIGRLVEGANLCGMLSVAERDTAAAGLAAIERGTPDSLAAGLRDLGRVVDWGRARVWMDLGPALERYKAIEPRAVSVVDDVLRGGVMLPLARFLDRLREDVESHAGGGHRLLGGLPAAAALSGETPGIAVGPLRVLGEGESPAALDRGDIALLRDLPPSLPPVRGILTVGSAGSLAHVSLLARNLGIPCAAVSSDLAEALAPLSGQELVFGVSIGRRVLLGPRAALSPAEQATLGTKDGTTPALLRLDHERLDLDSSDVLNLSQVSELDSGVTIGPKAAQLARLARLFPDRVSGAVVIPFGAFVRHVSQEVDDGPSPLTRLWAAYGHARTLQPAAAEALVAGELRRFREAIATQPFPDGFVEQVERGLDSLGPKESFGVFVRSDTNVEDLEQFTGAGLNETIANRVRRADIFAAIRQVWASPYSDRSFRWRQQVLMTPEHVYPSVLLHRTVPSEISGVMVTADLESGAADALTVSMSEGVSAVVDGGAPETVVLGPNGSVRLLSSARTAIRKLIPEPPGQGVVRAFASGRDVLLGEAERKELRAVAADILRVIPPRGALPWDVELGFAKGRLWLMQIRPLRSAKAPSMHPLLTSLDERARKASSGAGAFDLAAPLAQLKAPPDAGARPPP